MKLAPNQGKAPVRTEATTPEDTDLGKATAKVNEAETPHKAQSAPGLALVFFAKLDKESAKKAEDAVGKVKGVDKKETKADAEKGEISVRLTGKDKVVLADLEKALKDAGINASTTKEKKDDKKG